MTDVSNELEAPCVLFCVALCGVLLLYLAVAMAVWVVAMGVWMLVSHPVRLCRRAWRVATG